MDEARSALTLRVGAQLRRVPGVAPILDARARRIWERAEGQQVLHERAEAERQRAREDATREEGKARLQGLAAQRGLRINVGSGPSTLQGWTNVDIQCDWEDMVFMDATEPWPLPDASVDAINSEHFIEHIGLDEGRGYLAEAARVLRAGGVIRTSTPSLRGVVDTYLEADPEILAKYQERIAGWCEARNHSEMLNNTFLEWGHRHIYDVEALTEMLEEAGFVEIERAEFGRSRHPQLNGIDTHDDGELLRDLVFALDAVKPER